VRLIYVCSFLERQIGFATTKREVYVYAVNATRSDVSGRQYNTNERANETRACYGSDVRPVSLLVRPISRRVNNNNINYPAVRLIGKRNLPEIENTLAGYTRAEWETKCAHYRTRFSHTRVPTNNRVLRTRKKKFQARVCTTRNIKMET